MKSLLLLLVACQAWIPASVRLQIAEDPDGDGARAQDDCQPLDPSVHPGALETCDGRDQDCDGQVDEGTTGTTASFPDQDGDGYGDLGGARYDCVPPEGRVTDSTDCDDTSPSIHPGAPETCDGLDQDCDSQVDEDPVDPSTWYPDLDGDGYGEPTGGTSSCEAPPGFVSDGTDCDDATDAVHPDHEEVCGDDLDNDCDGGAAPCAGPAGDLSPADARATLTGGASDLMFGRSLAGPCDLDGDGQGDLVVGADSSTLAFLGPLTADLGSSLATYGWEGAGAVVACLGDVDGDLGDEIVVSDPDDGTHAAEGGTTWIVRSARAGTTSLDSVSTVLWGPLRSRSGAAVAALGDVDGDTAPDLAIAAVRDSLFLVSGALEGSGSLEERAFATLDAGQAGDSLALAGDVDGDGSIHLLVGGMVWEEYAGAAWLVPVSGASTPLGDPFFEGSGAQYQAGASVAGPGDTNGDGFDDLLVGVPGDDSGGDGAGAALLFLGGPEGPGSTPQASLVGEAASSHVGDGVAGAGDTDQDSLADLLAGSSRANVVYLVKGPVEGVLGLATAAARYQGEAGGFLGTAVAGPGDLDQDRWPDMVISDSATGSGTVWIFPGGPGL